MNSEVSQSNLYQAWMVANSRPTQMSEFQFLVRQLGREEVPSEAFRLSRSSTSAADRALACGRLLDLGIVAGEVLVVQLRAAWSEPIFIEVQGAQFALRRTEAECIFGIELHAATSTSSSAGSSSEVRK